MCASRDDHTADYVSRCEHEWVFTKNIVWHAGVVTWDWYCKRCHKVEARTP